MSDDDVPEVVIPQFPPRIYPTSSNSSGMEFFTNIAAEYEDTGSSSSAPKKIIFRNREQAHTELFRKYFGELPTYDDATFHLRYRMSKALFLIIVDDISNEFDWFKEGVDAKGQRSFTTIQKCTSALRQLAYGNVADNYEEGLAMSARTSRECLEFFCNAIIKLYGEEFLRSPTSHDIARLYETHESQHHFPGMIGSIDCTHWVWRNCPFALRGQYHRGDHQYPTIILEAVASQDLWFWHAYFGVAGSNNDINVIMQSPLFTPEMHGSAPDCSFTVNGRHYKRGYYLADGIYPPWSCFVKAYAYPSDHNEKVLKKLQESARKDVERAFGVLKTKFAILARPARMKKKQKIINTMYACVILHNMILKNDDHAISPVYIRDPPTVPNADPNFNRDLRDEQTHYTLRRDLTDHIASLNLDVSFDDE